MPDEGAPAAPGRIEIRGLTKRFGGVCAVDHLDVTVTPGRVTAFLGPNGAGKTTTLRMLLGLVQPTSGTATVDGAPYAQLSHPLRRVGALLEASDLHPARSGRDHLRVQARAAGIDAHRVDEVLAQVGLTADAGRRAGQYSLGMRQRLGLAAALLGDPGVLVLDEPANGLDPEGIRWLRELLRHYAQQGRTVLVSTHLLAEVQQIVDDVVVIARGRLLYAGTLAGLEQGAAPGVRVDSPDRPALLAALRAAHLHPRESADGVQVDDVTPARVGALAFAARVELHELVATGDSLEDVFLRLVADAA
ncbi:MAG: ATP-binding cassette domain-containing protein [Actinomycetota bacterium]